MIKEGLEVRYLGKLCSVIQVEEQGDPVSAMQLLVRMPIPDTVSSSSVWFHPISIAGVPVLISVEPLEMQSIEVSDQVGVLLSVSLALEEGEEEEDESTQIHPALQWHSRAKLMDEPLHPLWGEIKEEAASGRTKTKEFRGNSFAEAIEIAVAFLRKDLDPLLELVRSREERANHIKMETATSDFQGSVMKFMRYPYDQADLESLTREEDEF